MDLATQDEMFSAVRDYNDGCAFYEWFSREQGLKFKGQYFSSTLRGLGSILVDAVVKNGGMETLHIRPEEPLSYCNFYMGETPPDFQERIKKFEEHGIQLVSFEEASAAS